MRRALVSLAAFVASGAKTGYKTVEGLRRPEHRENCPPMRTIALAALFSLFVPLLAGGAQDLASLEQLRAQAERGDPEAQLEMGILYEYGYHLSDNKPPALAWYMLAAEQGVAKAAARRDALQAKMSAAELAEARRLYETWRAKIPPATQPPPPAAPPPATEAPAEAGATAAPVAP